MAGIVTRVTDAVRGQWELGRIVDRAAPNASPEQRQKLIEYQRSGDMFRSALGSSRRYADQSWATDFKGRARAAGVRTAGPKTMASDLAYVRDQVRHFSQTNPHAKQAIRVMTYWTIGDGINMTPRPATKALARRIDPVWRKWFLTNQCDATRHKNIYGLQDLIYRTMRESGEVIVRLRTRKAIDKLAVPLAVEVLEGDYLWDGATPAIKAGNSYCAGVEFAAIGHVEAYWLYKGHPDDQLIDRQPVRVPVIDPVTGMRQIVHLFEKTRPGQVRGEARAACVLQTGYGQRDLRITTLNRMRAQSKILHWLQRKPGATDEEARPPLYGIDGGERFSLDTGEVETTVPVNPDAGIDPYEVIDFINGEMLSDNTVLPLPAGLEVKESVITTPADYSPIMTDMHREVATGYGIPYELMTGDLSKINYASFKAGSQQFKAGCQADQQYFIDELCQFIWAGFVIAGNIAGLWAETEIPCDFRANAFLSVEPQKDIGVIILKLRNGLISPRRAAAELGEDLDELIAEIGEDKSKLEAVGVDIWGALALAAKAGVSAKDAGRTPSPN